MTALEKIMEDQVIGRQIIKELFKLSDTDLKKKIGSICGDDIRVKDIIVDDNQVTRIIVNMKPSEIKIYFYDGIEITINGIFYKPEHGSSKQLIKFNKHFKL